jgi:hypothetical protein
MDLYHFTIQYRRLYTVTEEKRDEIEDPDEHTKPLLASSDIKYLPNSNNNLFIWGSTPNSPGDLRILRFPYYADELLKKLQDNMNHELFNDDTTTSALVALQLNDPIFRLKIVLRKNSRIVAAVESLQPGASGADPFEPRLLKSVIPSTVTRLFPDEKIPEEAPSTLESIPRSGATETFERPPVEVLRAPHYPAIQTAPFSSIETKIDDSPAGTLSHKT